jgi:hypothetical protein
MSSQRSFFLVPVLVALVAACGSSGGGGGSGDPGSAAGTTQPASADGVEPTAEAAVPTAAAAEPTSNGGQAAPTEQAVAQGGGDIPAIADGPWGAGTATAEMSGGVSMTMKAAMPADLGYTMEGLTVFVFTNDDPGSVINITLSQSEQSGFGVSSAPANVSTAGGWGVDGCVIDVTRNDESGIAATFACDDIPAIGMTEAKAYTVDLEGSFEVAR